jgi:hypothetical protein
VALRGQREAPSIDFDADTTDVGILFAFCATAEIPDYIAEVSERAMRLADRAEYRDRTIVDTGATDHICNDHAKFIKFDPKPTCAYIRTGASPVQVNATGTIKIGILCADGKLNNVTFSNVLYALDMFVLIISHSQLRVKGLYYHGWDEKVYRKADGLEIAYTPEIDGIPNVLQALDSI